jgi:hypothetical protein
VLEGPELILDSHDYVNSLKFCSAVGTFGEYPSKLSVVVVVVVVALVVVAVVVVVHNYGTTWESHLLSC